MVAPLWNSTVSTPPGVLNSSERPIKVEKRRKSENRYSHFTSVVRKDFEFLLKGADNGLQWATQTLRLHPKVSKAVEDVVWLRNLENRSLRSYEVPSRPKNWYPGLSGVDLLMADWQAMKAYFAYFFCLSKMLSKPLPESYDPEDVAFYFTLRPHLLLLRILEVFAAFAFATMKIQVSRAEEHSSSGYHSEEAFLSKQKLGTILKETMLSLGPTFIKVGQSLSTRPDIIGPEISQALSELHEKIPPFPRDIAMNILEEELGSPIDSYFAYVSEEPVAAASFGQVYKGCTTDGDSVAVKIQRPELIHVVQRDMYLLRVGLGIVRRIANRKSDLRLYADELASGIVRELDYSHEASNASRFKEVHSSFPSMYVPKVYNHLSGKRVLTLEWVDGDNPSDLLAIATGRAVHSEIEQSEAKRRLLDMANKGVEATLGQLLETGLMHADPHPGNLRYMVSGQMAFLDFGLLCQLERRHQLAMQSSIVHIVNSDWPAFVNSLIQMDVVPRGTNLRIVIKEFETSLGDIKFRNGIPDVKFSKLLSKVWSVALKYHFRMPPYFTLVLRSIASFEGLVVAVDPNFKSFEASYPYVVQKLLTENTFETRKILHSVVFNERKEFRWERISLFLKVGSSGKVTSDQSLQNNTTRAIDVSNLALKLTQSKEGVVLRKLLMTANGASLVRAAVSKEASVMRRQMCTVIADVFLLWMLRTARMNTSHFNISSKSIIDYQMLLNDRRLQVICSKIVNSAKKDRALMAKFYWTCFTMACVSFAIACGRFFAAFPKSLSGPVDLSPTRLEPNAQVI